MEKKESEKKAKTFDAVEMTRRIRDRHFEDTREMTPENRLAYYRQKGREIHDRLVRQAHRRKPDHAA